MQGVNLGRGNGPDAGMPGTLQARAAYLLHADHPATEAGAVAKP